MEYKTSHVFSFSTSDQLKDMSQPRQPHALKDTISVIQVLTTRGILRRPTSTLNCYWHDGKLA